MFSVWIATSDADVDLLRHLRYFVAVADELHFGRAAERLHMAQPPLSQRIRGLERHLGVTLFDRSSRRVALTPAGRMLLPEALDLVARAERVDDLAERLRSDGPERLRAAAPQDVTGAGLAAAVAGFTGSHPDAQLELREMADAPAIRAIVDGELDVAVVRRPLSSASVEEGAAYQRPLGVLLAADSELAAREEVELAALTGMDLVLFPRDAAPAVYDDTLATARAYGFAPRSIHHAVGASFVAGLLLGGDAVVFTEQASSEPGLTWRALAGAPLRVEVCVAWRRGERTEAVAAFDVAFQASLRERGWTAMRTVHPVSVAPRPAYGLLT